MEREIHFPRAVFGARAPRQVTRTPLFTPALTVTEAERLPEATPQTLQLSERFLNSAIYKVAKSRLERTRDVDNTRSNLTIGSRFVFRGADANSSLVWKVCISCGDGLRDHFVRPAILAEDDRADDKSPKLFIHDACCSEHDLPISD